MAFRAVDSTGYTTNVRYADSPPYTCAGCGAPMLIRQGRLVQPHFAHHPGTSCDWEAEESETHLAMKAWIEQHFDNVELEVVIADHRTDAVVTFPEDNWQIAVECQASPISIDEWERRTNDLNTAGYPVWWLWSARRINMDRGKTDECGVPAEILHAHHTQGVIYVLDDAHRLLVATLGDASERDSRYIEDLDVDAYTPVVLKRWCSTFADTANPYINDDDGYELVEFADRLTVKRRAHQRRFTYQIPPPEPVDA